jgi:rubrerythrin
VQDVEVDVDVRVDDSGFADFAVAGADVSGEFRCPDCGYGAVVRRALPPCPMCGGMVWEIRLPRLVA